MVVEMLTFEVSPTERAGWLAVEESVWSRFLEQQAGFVRKQMWVDQQDPHRVHAMIWWESMELWKQIDAAKVAEVDELMGPWLREGSLRTFDVIREC